MKKKNKLFLWFSCLLVVFILFISVGISVNADMWSDNDTQTDTFSYIYNDNEYIFYSKSFVDFDYLKLDYYNSGNDVFYRDAVFSTNSVINSLPLNNNYTQTRLTQNNGSDPWVIDCYSTSSVPNYDYVDIINQYDINSFQRALGVEQIRLYKNNFYFSKYLANIYNDYYYFFNEDDARLTFDFTYNLTYSYDGYLRFESGTIEDVTTISCLPTDYMLRLTAGIDTYTSVYVQSFEIIIYFESYCYSFNSIIPFTNAEFYSTYYHDLPELYASQIRQSVSIGELGSIGDNLLDSVNGFMQFEIVPHFTLLHLLFTIVAIPLLIWILKLFLGG